jgi:RND family efflux transporter MFP subunit
MTSPANGRARRLNVPPKAVAGAAALAGLVLLLLYLQGVLGGHKVTPGVVPLAGVSAPPGTMVAVEERDVADVVEWPGTVTSRWAAQVAPAVMARVVEVRVSVGATVRKGDVIAVLDDRDLGARAQQGAAALAAAEAQAQRAEGDLLRARRLFEKQALTQQDLDAAEAHGKSARAQVAQARDALNEARVRLGETLVRAPFDGVVAARLVDPGDMAGPAQPVVAIQDPGALRLEAHLPEACAAPVAVGGEVAVRFGAPPQEIAARVEEVAPVADPQSRTRLIKAALPPQPPLRPGAFATLRMACGSHRAVLVPASAVRRAGQLESVRVSVDGELLVRSVRTGKSYGDRVEILSGLRAGEMVLTELDGTGNSP